MYLPVGTSVGGLLSPPHPRPFLVGLYPFLNKEYRATKGSGRKDHAIGMGNTVTGFIIYKKLLLYLSMCLHMGAQKRSYQTPIVSLVLIYKNIGKELSDFTTREIQN